MNEKHIFSRRKFLVGSATALGGAFLAWTHHLLGMPATQAQEPTLTPQAYLPLLLGSGEPLPGPSKPRVVHVHDPRATEWDGTGMFYNAVDQATVTNMVHSGLQLLTGQETWPDIWNALFERVQPGGYSAGQKIAVKVNLNMTYEFDCESHGNIIDALPQPVLGMISGLVAAGVLPGDIFVYDSIRDPTSYFRNPIWAAYPDVNLLGAFPGTSPCPGVIAPSYGVDPSLTVGFNDPDGYIEDRQLADVLYEATYLINMPISKAHTGQDNNPVTLSFKNHFGSLDSITGNGGNDDLHNYIYNSHDLYQTTYSPLVDIWLNPNIRDKTILILGDGLYGGTSWGSPPIQSWSIFGNDACNSLFFGIDPVATDCIMADLIVAEGMVTREHTYDYLFCAQEAGLGTCEGTRSDPGGEPLQTPHGSGYQDIEYVRMDLGSG
jgi:hypothetical protein